MLFLDRVGFALEGNISFWIWHNQCLKFSTHKWSTPVLPSVPLHRHHHYVLYSLTSVLWLSSGWHISHHFAGTLWLIMQIF